MLRELLEVSIWNKGYGTVVVRQNTLCLLQRSILVITNDRRWIALLSPSLFRARGMLAKAAKTVAKSTPIPMREMAIHSGWKKVRLLARSLSLCLYGRLNYKALKFIVAYQRVSCNNSCVTGPLAQWIEHLTSNQKR